MKKIRRILTHWDWEREALFKNKLLSTAKKSKNNIDSIIASIIMPTYNRADIISRAINSVLFQSHKNWELLIIDDGSTDETELFITPLLSDSRIRYIKNEHAGISAARNCGLEMAKGEYVFYLDSDNYWNNEYLELIIHYMALGNLDAAYCGLRVIDEAGMIKYFRGDEFDWESCYKKNYIDMNCFAHSQQASEDIRFDTTIHRLVDWDFILRFTCLNRTSFAPFCGVTYTDSNDKERITLREYQHADINTLQNIIRQKFDGQNVEQYSNVAIRPLWNDFFGSAS